jgi:outer membrane protein TolC
MDIRIVVAVAALSVATAPLAAQDMTVRGDTIDLARAIAMARVANPRIAAAGAEVAAASARIGPAGALPDPILGLGLMNRMLPRFSAADPLSMNQLSLTQMVPVNGSLGLRRSIARSDSLRTVWDRQAMTLMVEREVRARYWDLYHTDRALDIMDRTLGVLRDLAAIANTMYTVGQTVQSDVVRSQVAITRVQQEIVEMRLQRRVAAAAFNQWLARPGDAPVVLTADAQPAHGAPLRVSDLPALPALESLLVLADSGNPEIGAAAAQVRAATTGVTLAHRMLLPDLELGAAYGQRPSDNDMLSLMVGVSVPIFARSRQLRWRDEARAMRSAAEEMLRNRRVEVSSMLATAVAEAETARRQVEIYMSSLVPQAFASYEAALAAYRVGRVDFPNVLDAQLALLQYEHDLHRYEAMFGTAIAEVDRLIGQPFGAMPWNR